MLDFCVKEMPHCIVVYLAVYTRPNYSGLKKHPLFTVETHDHTYLNSTRGIFDGYNKHPIVKNAAKKSGKSIKDLPLLKTFGKKGKPKAIPIEVFDLEAYQALRM